MRRHSTRNSSQKGLPNFFDWLSRSSNTTMSKFTASEIKELTSCLHLRVDSPGADCSRIRFAIDHIPHHLRASKMTNIFSRAGLFKKLCCVHEGLDSAAVSSIFDSLRAEVIDSVQSLRQYAYLLGPDENMALGRTAGIEGMWRESMNKDRLNHSMRWKYQVDQCQGCMISRVASNPAVLRELRTLILAKITGTGSTNSNEKGLLHHSATFNNPLILSFINEWIMLTDQKDELFYLSGQRAAVIKDAKQEWREMKAMNEGHIGSKSSIFTETMSERPMLRLSTTSQSTPSLTRTSTTPEHPSTLSRPPSRSAQEFSEIESILQSYALDIDPDVFQLPPSDKSYSSSTISDYSHDDSMTTMSSLQREVDVVTSQFYPNDTLYPNDPLAPPYYTHDPVSPTELLQDPRSRFLISPYSSAETLTSFVIYPECYELHRCSESGTELSGTIPPLRSHSPFDVPHLVPSRRPSMRSSNSSVNGQGQTAKPTMGGRLEVPRRLV
jgi:hypothetical protein